MDDVTMLTHRTATGDGGASPYGRCAGFYQALPGVAVPNQGPEIAAAIWTLLGLSTAFLLARICIKHQRSKSLWWDDWMLITSWICFTVDATMSQIVINLGLGKYPCAIDPRNLSTIGLIGNIGATYGILGVVWSKTSFAITLLRITEGTTKSFVWFIIVSMNIIMLLLAMFTWIQCSPISKTWDHTVQGTCWSSSFTTGYGVFSGVYSGIMDIALALIPWKILWNLRIKKTEKLGVAIGMSMGLFASATAFIKSSKIPTLGSDNFTHDGTELLLWAGAEIGTTIMAACIPVLRALTREVHNRSNARRNHGHNSRVSAPSFRRNVSVDDSIDGNRESPPRTNVGEERNHNSKAPLMFVSPQDSKLTRLESHESDGEIEDILLPFQGAVLQIPDPEKGRNVVQSQHLDPGKQEERSSPQPGQPELDKMSDRT